MADIKVIIALRVGGTWRVSPSLSSGNTEFYMGGGAVATEPL